MSEDFEGFQCSICGEEFEKEWGNNPWPVVQDEDARCCDDCNNTWVVPARFRELNAYLQGKGERNDKEQETHNG